MQAKGEDRLPRQQGRVVARFEQRLEPVGTPLRSETGRLGESREPVGKGNRRPPHQAAVLGGEAEGFFRPGGERMAGNRGAVGWGRAHFDGIAECFRRRRDRHLRHPLQGLVDHIVGGDLDAE